MEKSSVSANSTSRKVLTETEDGKVLRDPFYFVKICTFIIGMTSLLPWNLFITANDYWMYKLRNVSAVDNNETEEAVLTPLQYDFTSYLVIASNIPFVIFLVVNTLVAHRFSPTTRISWSLGVTALLFAATACIVYVDTDNAQIEFVGGTLASAVLINVVGAFLKGAGTGIAGFLPRNYMNSYVYGQAMGGIFVSAAQIMALLASSNSQASALAYFLCAVITLVITLIAFLGMVRTDFYNYYFSSQIGKTYQDLDTEKPSESVRVPFLLLAKEIWIYELATLIIFSVTLSVFPAVMVLIKSMGHTGSPMEKTYFLPVYCFLIFNVGDIVGRIIASKVLLPGKKGYLELTLSILRLFFIPLFLLCNGQPRKLLPLVFDNDAYFAVFVALFAISNGFIYAGIMAKAPSLVQTQYKETVSSMLALFLGLGIMVGSVASYGTIHLF